MIMLRTCTLTIAMHSRRSTIAALLLFTFATIVKTEDVLVTVQQGTLRGTTATSAYHTSYTAFLGIPYAQPPLGELRFQAPQPATSWEGVREATEYGSDCVQSDGTGSEDCLYLNVYVPGVPEEGAGLPVMFWVHGGGFVVGSGSDEEHGPDFLISYGVILVTINYRLGAIGFLSTGDSVAPGNAGLKDQQLALSWVQRNIASFGGDPQQVTLQGQSAGGSSVSLHFVSPMSSGLFSRLIIESGNFIARPILQATAARQRAFRLGAALGFETDDSQQLISFLRSVNATDLLVDSSLILTDEEQNQIISMLWAPNIESELEGAFIPESPIQALLDGRFSQVPVLTGVTSGELGFSILEDPSLVNSLNEAFENAVGPCLHLPTLEQQTSASQKLRDFYFGNGTISLNDTDTLVNFNNDIGTFEPTDSLVRKLASISNLTVYYYEFDYRGVNVPTTPWGVIHSGELPFLFLRKDTEYNLDPTSEEEQIRRNVLRLWTNFAKYGNPTPEADPVVWEPYDLTSRSYLLMQANFSLEHDRLGERMDFWNENVPLLPYPSTI
ncbi:cholinesterase-like [Schistocerca gregaria]|uniref:cholinesterase-like n=1 Tax=Schistocerca gregaria TaxID=7010 RepID=UPI00211E7946|nr:cholinesterase-like [Schistocerca gregaria]